VRFAALGAQVVVADLDLDAAGRTAAAIAEAGGTAAVCAVDVRFADQVEAMVGFVIERFGRLDVAHNNAGVDAPHRPLADVSEQEWDLTTGVDLKGVWLCMRSEIPEMIRVGGGAIVNTSSAAGLIGVSGAAPYCASKHGVIGLTKVAALDYARSGVRVNAVCPGLIATPLVTAVLGSAVQEFVDTRIPLGRIGQPSDVAEAVTWLCSDDAAFITGVALAMDGGGLAGL
jgi:NAD(P)-dependent dehydrogenase (short-subunit alcohol dehydrogenase family)